MRLRLFSGLSRSESELDKLENELRRHGERTGLDQAKLIKALVLVGDLYHFHKMQGQRVLQVQVFLLLDR